MITNRTSLDVSEFIRYRNIIGSGKDFVDEPLRGDEILEIMLRGSLNNVTLNRIEDKTRELAELLNQYKYCVTVNTIVYTDDYKFSILDLNRTLNNLNKLKRAYFIYSYTPETPKTMYDYQSLNDVEKILVDIGDMIDDMESNFRICGTFECGA